MGERPGHSDMARDRAGQGRPRWCPWWDRALVTLREHWRDGILSLLVGAICAVYLGPLVAPILEPVIGNLAPGGDNRWLQRLRRRYRRHVDLGGC